MSYLPTKRDLVMIELTLSSAQTASQGDFVKWDTVRATGTHGVSINATTGEVSLDPSRQYHIIASIDVDRSSTSSDWAFNWCDSTGTELTYAQGSFDGRWQYPPGPTTTNRNATFTAVYQSATPESVIKLKATQLAASSSFNTSFRCLIMEAS